MLFFNKTELSKIIKHIGINGIPFPMVTDPKTGKGSVTVTLVVVSSGVCFIAIFLMMTVFFAKLNHWYILNDDTFHSLEKAFDSAFNVFLTSLGAYLGRRFQSKDLKSSKEFDKTSNE